MINLWKLYRWISCRPPIFGSSISMQPTNIFYTWLHACISSVVLLNYTDSRNRSNGVNPGESSVVPSCKASSCKLREFRTPNRLNLVVNVEHSRGIISRDADLLCSRVAPPPFRILAAPRRHPRSSNYEAPKRPEIKLSPPITIWVKSN